MTAAELAEHRTASHGRDLSRSDDGYDDMYLAHAEGWQPLATWGRDGWNLGNWPYVAIYVRDRAETPELQLRGAKHELMQITEGDHTLYRFDHAKDRNAAIDYLFLWYSADKSWAPLTYEQRAQLDTGELSVDGKFRGPYSADRQPAPDDPPVSPEDNLPDVPQIEAEC